MGDHRLYVFATHKDVQGILRVGKKSLYVRKSVNSEYQEISPLCVLDFYVHESKQRSGVGKQLFEFMLQQERASPSRLGYDRPSAKLRGFLSKHYKLSNFLPQSNNFVIFSQ